MGGQVSWFILEKKHLFLCFTLSSSLSAHGWGERAVSDGRCLNDLFAVHFDCTFGTLSGCHSHLMSELFWCLANRSPFRPADRHIVVCVLSETYKSLEINSVGLYKLHKRLGFPLLWCCTDSPSSHDPQFIVSVSNAKLWLWCVYRFVYKACCVNSWALEGRSTWELLCLGFTDHAQ